jgi:hypothetical protein
MARTPPVEYTMSFISEVQPSLLSSLSHSPERAKLLANPKVKHPMLTHSVAVKNTSVVARKIPTAFEAVYPGSSLMTYQWWRAFKVGQKSTYVAPLVTALQQFDKQSGHGGVECVVNPHSLKDA